MPTLEETNSKYLEALGSPRLMYVQDLTTLEVLEAQFNPAKLERSVNVNFARLVSPGLSHQPLKYNYTENLKISIEVVFDALHPTISADGFEHAQRFLNSLCYLKRDGQLSRALFVWPGMMSMACVVTSLKFEDLRFNLQGVSTLMNVKVGLEEIRATRLTSEDVLEKVDLRAPST